MTEILPQGPKTSHASQVSKYSNITGEEGIKKGNGFIQEKIVASGYYK